MNSKTLLDTVPMSKNGLMMTLIRRGYTSLLFAQYEMQEMALLGSSEWSLGGREWSITLCLKIKIARGLLD